MFSGGEKVCMAISAKAYEDLDMPIIGFVVKDRLGQILFGENTLQYTDAYPLIVKAGDNCMAKFIFVLPMLPNGEYSVMVSIANGDRCDNIQHHYLHDALIFNVTSGKSRYGLVGIPFECITLGLDK